MIITVDVGGTKTLVASFSTEGKKLDSIKFATPTSEDEFFDELNSAISKVKSSDATCISIAMPGLIDRKKGVVIGFGNLDWKNVAIREKLEKEHKLPVLIDNDANLAGLAEACELDIDEFPLVVYITVSTGIGTGIIDRQRIHSEFADSEAGQMQFSYEGKTDQMGAFCLWQGYKEKVRQTSLRDKRRQDLERNFRTPLPWFYSHYFSNPARYYRCGRRRRDASAEVQEIPSKRPRKSCPRLPCYAREKTQDSQSKEARRSSYIRLLLAR